MNFKKYTAAALVILLASPMVAQKDKKTNASQHKIENITDVDAAIKGIEAIVHNNLADVEPVVAQICESQQTKKQKCPEIYVGAANAFWTKSGVSDTTYAQRYIDKAIAIAPNYAPAYILKADIYKWADDTTKAVSYYKKAIEMAPTDLRGYRSYVAFREKNLQQLYKDAKEFQDPLEMGELHRRIDELCGIYKTAKESNPTFPYTLECARLYFQYGITNNDNAKSWSLYQECEKDSMLYNDYVNEATLLKGFAGNDNIDASTKFRYLQREIEICDSGLMKFPNQFYILRAGMYGANDAYDLVKNQRSEEVLKLKKHFSSKGVTYGQALFATKDTSIVDLDHFHYGKALINDNKQEEGIAELGELLNSPTVPDDQASAAMNLIANAYKDLGDYDKAEQAYERSIKKLESNGRLQYYHLQNYAKLFEEKAEETVGAEQMAAYKKAFDIYGEGAAKFPDYAHYGYYNQLDLAKKLDPDKTTGLGFEPAKKLYALAQAKGNEISSSFGINACYYLAFYYLDRKNNAAGKPYWMYLHNVDPSNESIKNAIFKLYKIKL